MVYIYIYILINICKIPFIYEFRLHELKELIRLSFYMCISFKVFILYGFQQEMFPFFKQLNGCFSMDIYIYIYIYTHTLVACEAKAYQTTYYPWNLLGQIFIYINFQLMFIAKHNAWFWFTSDIRWFALLLWWFWCKYM